jgi:hypothetical protein
MFLVVVEASHILRKGTLTFSSLFSNLKLILALDEYTGLRFQEALTVS